MKTFKQFLIEIHGLDDYISQEGKPHPDLKYPPPSPPSPDSIAAYVNEDHDIRTLFILGPKRSM